MSLQHAFSVFRTRFSPFVFAMTWLRTRAWKSLVWSTPAIGIALGAAAVMSESAAVSDGDRLNRYVAAAERAIAREDFEGAELRYRRAMQIDPSNGDVRFGIGVVTAQQGDMPRAVQQMSVLAEERTESGARAAFWIVEKMLESKNLSRDDQRLLLNRLERIVEISPKHVPARLELARRYVEAGFATRAVEHMKAAAAEQPEHLLLLSQVYTRAGQPAQARVTAEQASRYWTRRLEVEPQNVVARMRYADSLMALNRHQDAVDAINEGLRLGNSPELRRHAGAIHAVLASVAIKSRDSAAALTLLSAALQYDPASVPALSLLTSLAGEQDSSAEARRMLKERLAAGNVPWMIHLLLGTSAAGDDSAEAERHLEQALALNPKVPETLNNLAWVLSAQQPPKLERALELADQAVSLAPARPEFRETRGQILVKLMRWQDALADLELALPAYNSSEALRPGVSKIHDALAAAYAGLGDDQMASEHQRLAAARGGSAALP
ncbi:MAG: tetratricopeptide repeat protein [Planctomyces sp.]|nr:tetratricopeptide repeat protein [Planctomyces sp.]